MSDRQLIADLLSALEYHTEQTRPIEFSKVAIEAAREYLRKPAQPSKPWIGLTDEEIAELHCEIKVRLMGTYKTEDIYRAIEAKLKEKNT